MTRPNVETLDAEFQADWVVRDYVERELDLYEDAYKKADCNPCRVRVMKIYLDSDALDRANWANHNGRWTLTDEVRKQQEE